MEKNPAVRVYGRFHPTSLTVFVRLKNLTRSSVQIPLKTDQAQIRSHEFNWFGQNSNPVCVSVTVSECVSVCAGVFV